MKFKMTISLKRIKQTFKIPLDFWFQTVLYSSNFRAVCHESNYIIYSINIYIYISSIDGVLERSQMGITQLDTVKIHFCNKG